MHTFIVTRHAGAIDWLRRFFDASDLTVLHHVDKHAFGPGDRVCGVLPLAVAARICAAGAEAHVLSCEVPESLRGHELSASMLDTLGARLVRYDVRVLEPSISKQAKQREVGSSARLPSRHK